MKLFSKALASGLLCLLATVSTVSAQSCPTRDALSDNGIRLTRSSPFMTILLTNRGDTLIEERHTKRNGKTQHTHTTYLHPLAVAQRRDSRSALTMKYSRNTKTLSRLDQTKVWRSKIEVLDGTKTIMKGRVTMRLNGKGTHKVGRCSYPVWSIIENHELSGRPTSYLEKIYAPTLGVVLATYRLAQGGKSRVSGFVPSQITAE
ncbi:hypothetical protein [Sulfitobacter donghicola]|uniref:DUF3108 domain-containing protein n=1 Tax=Sulfitobacter donghicola DSW-25 = KCTC 12864 = JCM 14565 TaxID=1300350 RepID=A0A073II35_9RHOB|nr:hypothetical protein [Sulfitobacter donghicola]KEJ89166.1 hypothetical protein DSW25_12815 [Sulfitobacter donghicola DSW-25 = KCTC 12864 = JCM 14565]KIN67324.1 hypothetical protein Z948_1037 [Sulfitobacter donghicola DSW-25 = KCTC 12864 = JCM 14565]